MTYSKEPELTLSEHTAYEQGKSHALCNWQKRLHSTRTYNEAMWYKFGYAKGLAERKKKELQDLIQSSP